MTEHDVAAALSKLGAEVSASLESARVARAAGSRVRAKLLAREKPRLRARRAVPWRALIGGLAAAAVIGLGLSFVTRERPSTAASADALSFVVGEGASEKPGAAGAFLAAPPTSEVPLTFSDGSKIRLAPSARVRVTDVAKSGARVLVENGDVHVSVVHRDDTKWSVEAGPFEVRVTGTQFGVRYDAVSTSLVVRLEEGSVYVRGCDMLGEQGRLLRAGEKLEVSCKDRVERVTPLAEPVERVTPLAEPAEPAESVSEPASEPAPSASVVTPPVAVVTPSALPDAPPEIAASASAVAPAEAASSAPPPATGPRRAVELARQGSHAEAVMAAEASGFAATCEALSGPELLLLADASRYAARFERATEALEAARRRFRGTDAAATAAFELGRIAMDVGRDLPAAGDHFETYLRERPNGSLAREALGRALEARHRSGDNVRAERLALRYLAAYPEGPFAKLARKVVAEASGNAP